MEMGSDTVTPITDSPHAATPEPSPSGDRLDLLLAQLGVVRPDLVPGGLAVTGRILRLAARLSDLRNEWLAPLGLTLGEFDVLATIRRAEVITAREISNATMITAGGVTKRLDRLEARDLLKRELDGSDRRSFRISLTPSGIGLVDDAYDVVVAAENALVSEALEDSTPLIDALRQLAEAISES